MEKCSLNPKFVTHKQEQRYLFDCWEDEVKKIYVPSSEAKAEKVFKKWYSSHSTHNQALCPHSRMGDETILEAELPVCGGEKV